jgi:hypothetical protein
MVVTTKSMVFLLAAAAAWSYAPTARADVFEEKCPAFATTHSVEGGWRDLGNGFVAYYTTGGDMGLDIVDSETGKTTPYPASSATWLTVEGCATGNSLIAKVFDCEFWGDECTRKEIKIDVRKGASALLDKAVLSETSMTLESLSKGLQALATEAELRPSERAESCACSVAYPELRGKKDRYEYSSAY